MARGVRTALKGPRWFECRFLNITSVWFHHFYQQELCRFRRLLIVLLSYLCCIGEVCRVATGDMTQWHIYTTYGQTRRACTTDQNNREPQAHTAWWIVDGRGPLDPLFVAGLLAAILYLQWSGWLSSRL